MKRAHAAPTTRAGFLQAQGVLTLWKARRLVCADGTLLAPAQRACLRTRSLAPPAQRALGLYLPGNDLMLHVAVGTQAEGERQMLFDQLDRLRRGDVLILDRGYPASWLVQALAHGVYARDEAAHRDRIRAFKLK